jgi:hypothetical protein
LPDEDVGKLWRQYKLLRGKDATADLIVALIRKLIIELALAIPYGNWEDKLSHPLRKSGIAKSEWEDGG